MNIVLIQIISYNYIGNLPNLLNFCFDRLKKNYSKKKYELTNVFVLHNQDTWLLFVMSYFCY